jgi:hypothetical protein
VDEHRGRCARVQLTHVSSEDVAVNAAQEAHLVGVNAPSIRPVSNRTQAQLKVVHAVGVHGSVHHSEHIHIQENATFQSFGCNGNGAAHTNETKAKWTMGKHRKQHVYLPKQISHREVAYSTCAR